MKMASGSGFSEKISMLLNAVTMINSIFTEGERFYDCILECLSNLIEFTSGSIQLLENNFLKVVACKGKFFEKNSSKVKFPVNPDFPDYLVVKKMKPVSFDDIRISYPQFAAKRDDFKTGNIRSWVGIPMLSSNSAIGMITLDRDKVEPFNMDEIDMASILASQAATVHVNLKNRCDLNESLILKDKMLRQLNHRIRNNLQLITGIIAFQLKDAENEKYAGLLKEIESRILSIAYSHQRLSMIDDSGESVELAFFLEDVCSGLYSTFIEEVSSIRFKTSFEPFLCKMKIAIPLGLILDELIINAIKYAFPIDHSGLISMNFHVQDSIGILIMEDNGIGIRECNSKNGMGKSMIHELSEQINGEAKLESASGWTRWTIKFPIQ